MEQSTSPCKKSSSCFFDVRVNPLDTGIEEEVDHQAPRHLADWETGISMPSILMWDRFLGLEGDMTASHFSVLRQRFLEFAKELTAFTCLLQSLRLVDRVRMSSALDNAPRRG